MVWSLHSRWKDVQQIQVLTAPGAFDDLATNDGAKRGCATAPKAANKGQPPCSAVTGHEGVTFDVSDVAQGHATMVTLKRALPAVREASYSFGLEHICAQDALPQQQVRRRLPACAPHALRVTASACAWARMRGACEQRRRSDLLSPACMLALW